MQEHCGAKAPRDLRVTFIGDATNVCNSLAAICTRLGMHFTHAAPERYQIAPQVRQMAQDNCTASGGTLTVTPDVEAAVAAADFLYTDLWWWIGQESEIPERRAAFMPRYQINAQLLARAPASCRVMHCLPASRGVEATSEVLDSPQSIIFDQAENRLHVEKALLVWAVHARRKRPSAQLRAWHAGRVEQLLAEINP
jgi:putrescine carbamoyltransferase